MHLLIAGVALLLLLTLQALRGRVVLVEFWTYG